MSPIKTALALAALSLSWFVIGVGSLSIVGLVVPMAADLAVAPHTVALLVSVFALTYALAAPLAQVGIGGLTQRRLLLMGLAAMAAGSALSAALPDFAVVTAGRILMAAGAAVVGPVASACAAGLVPEARKGFALGLVFSGMSMATVLGVPLASHLGALFGWEAVMLAVAALAVLAAALVAATVPGGARGGRTTLSALARVVRDPVLLPALSVNFLHMLAQFTTYALIALLVTEAFGLQSTVVPVLLAVFGIGGILGNGLSTFLLRRMRAADLIVLGLAGMAAALLALALVPPHTMLIAGIVFLWATLSIMMIAPQQTHLLTLAATTRPPYGATPAGEVAPALVLALSLALTQLGIAAGSALSGGVYGALGAAALPMVSAGLATIAILAHVLSRLLAARTLEKRARERHGALA